MEGEKGMEVRYYICKHCGNIVEKVKDKGVPVICCGEPMQERYYICKHCGNYRKQLNPGQEPVADFCLCDGEQVEEVYAYCNLHGLWKC